MDIAFRRLEVRELALIERLCQREFTGAEDLRTQIGALTAKRLADDGTLVLRCTAGTAARTKYRCVAEGRCFDSDGGKIAILLHVNAEGFLHMLEIFKEDGTPILRPPSASDLVIW